MPTKLSYVTSLLGILSLAATALAIPQAGLSTSQPLVDLGYATIQGSVVQDRVTGNDHTAFLGVRYAAAPIGERYS